MGAGQPILLQGPSPELRQSEACAQTFTGKTFA